MPKTKEQENATALTGAWLRRSEKLPLTLSLLVIGSGRSTRDLQATAQAVLFTLADHASRWEYVHFNWIFGNPILIPGLEDTPYLRSFNVMTSHPIIAPFPFSSCPKLTEISWPYAFDVSSSRDMPWHQLTCLRLDHTMLLSEMLILLQACPKLVELRIVVDDYTIEELPRKKVITSHSLQKLHLTVYVKCKSLLKRLTLPALTDFTLHMDEGFQSVQEVHKQLLRFFSRSECKLDRLELRDCDFHDGLLLTCFQHPGCAFLTELNIMNGQHNPMFTDIVLAALTEPINGDSYALLPYLKRLSLEKCLAGSPGVLGTMILSRCLLWEKEDQLNQVNVTDEELDERDYLLIKLAEVQGLSTKIVFAYDYADSEVQLNTFLYRSKTNYR